MDVGFMDLGPGIMYMGFMDVGIGSNGYGSPAFGDRG